MSARNRICTSLGVVVILAVLLILWSNRAEREDEVAPSTAMPALRTPQPTAVATPPGAVASPSPDASAPSAPVDPVVTGEPVRDLGEDWIVGEVTDERDDPIAGATVRVCTTRIAGPLGKSGAIRGLPPVIVERSATETDQKGLYSVPAGDELPLIVVVRAEGFAETQISLRPEFVARSLDSEGRRLIRADAQLVRAVEFRGRVVDTDANPVAGVRLTMTQRRDSPRAIWTSPCKTTSVSDSDGRFLFDGVLPTEGTLLLQRDGYVSVEHSVADFGISRDWVIPTVGGTISGRVLLKGSGSPVAGITVEAWSGKPSSQFNMAPFMESAVTDGLGQFRIPRLRAGIWDITARTETLQPVDPESPFLRRVTLGEAESVSGVLLTLGNGREIGGIVVDANSGAGIPGAIVREVRWNGQEIGAIVCDADGRFSMTGVFGNIERSVKPNVIFVADKPGWSAKERVKVELGGEEPVENIRIEMLPEVGVSGVVRDEAGKPVPRAQIRLYRGWAGIPTPVTFTDEEGQFRTSAPVHSKSQIEAVVGDLASYSRLFEVADDPVDGIVLKLDPGGSAIARCVDPDGKLVGDVVVTARVSINTLDGTGSITRIERRLLADPAEIRFDRLPSADAIMPFDLMRRAVEIDARGELWMDVRADDVRVPPGGTIVATLQMKPKDTTHRIEGIVVDWQDKPVEGATVRAFNGSSSITTTTDVLGAFRLEQLMSGEYSLTVDHSSYLALSQKAMSDSVDVRLALMPRTSWSANVVDADTGVALSPCMLTLFSTPNSMVSQTFERGPILIRGLVPGRVQSAKVTCAGYEPSEVQALIPEGQNRAETEIRLRKAANGTSTP